MGDWAAGVLNLAGSELRNRTPRATYREQSVPCFPVNWSDTVCKLDSGSSLGDLNVDQCVILSLVSWLLCVVADCVIFLNIESNQTVLHVV